MKTKIFSRLVCVLALSFVLHANADAQRHGRWYGPRVYRSNVFYRPYVRPYRMYPIYNPFIYTRSFSYYGPGIGMRVSVLPFGFSRIFFGPSLFFYSDGIFYRQYDQQYEVVQAPVGAEVPNLPARARPMTIDGQKYYEYNGNFFQETVKSNGEIWYTVVGKHGRLETGADNNTNTPGNNPSYTPNSNDNNPSNNSAPVGTVVANLPNGSKTVVLNNQKYFVAPDNTYYEEVIQNNQVMYKVSARPQ